MPIIASDKNRNNFSYYNKDQLSELYKKFFMLI